MNAALKRCVAAIALAACGSSREASDSASASPRIDSTPLDCGVEAPPAIGALTSRGIGALRVGAAVSDLRSRCRVIGDTTIPGPEGTRERRVTFVLVGDSVSATIDGDSVWRIEVDSPRFRTSDSLGVGSLGRDLKRGAGEIATGEGNVAALRRNHCGLSFLLSGANARTRWATLPDSARVRRVLIIGCPPGAPEN